jgi:hypothetical protein
MSTDAPMTTEPRAEGSDPVSDALAVPTPSWVEREAALLKQINVLKSKLGGEMAANGSKTLRRDVAHKEWVIRQQRDHLDRLRAVLTEAREVLWTINMDATEYWQAGQMVEGIDAALSRSTESREQQPAESALVGPHCPETKP